jgi:hypothetical protein
MSKLRVESFTISLDGFGAGPDQDINNPARVKVVVASFMQPTAV